MAHRVKNIQYALYRRHSVSHHVAFIWHCFIWAQASTLSALGSYSVTLTECDRNRIILVHWATQNICEVLFVTVDVYNKGTYSIKLV